LAIARETSGTVNGNALGGPFNVAVPSGIHSGDVLLYFMVSASTLGATTPPTGWSQTSLGTVTRTGLVVQVWSHVAGASEPANYVWNYANSSVHCQWLLVAWTGVSNTTPIDVAMTSANGTTTPDSAAAITPVTANAWVVTHLAAVNNISWTAPVTTPATNTYVTTGLGEDLFDEGPCTSFPIGARTFTPSGTSGAWIAISIALRPAAGTIHTGLTGSGSVGVASPGAIQVVCSGTISAGGTGVGNPARYFGLGNISWATANGAMRNFFIEHSTELIPAPINDATTVYYSFAPGVTGQITELATP
jgi:hypothetical protein